MTGGKKKERKTYPLGGSNASARGLFKFTSTTAVQMVSVLLHKKMSSLLSSRKYQLPDIQSRAT